MTKLILTSPQELETWLDEFMAEKMSELHIPGVTFSLVIHHSGSLPGFASLLYLFPDRDLGFFVSNNGRSGINGQLIEQFCDCVASRRYFPIEQNTNSYQPSAEDIQALKRYQGSYRDNRYARRTLGKINLLLETEYSRN